MRFVEFLGRAATASLFMLSAEGAANSVSAKDAVVLHNFNNTDGNEPTFVLLTADKTLYGVTVLGGGVPDATGRGVLYKIDPQGNFSILHAFADTPDGSIPGRLVQGPNGKIYGVTGSGGRHSGGTVYTIDSSDHYKIIHNFDFSKDGAGPNFLLLGKDGNFYGTASIGGIPQAGCHLSESHGTLFRMTPDGKVTRLHTFCEEIDGSGPDSVTEAADGFLYGTCKQDGPNGQNLGAGTFWRASYSGKLKLLHVFTQYPEPAAPNGVLQAPDGFFYGTSNGGGTDLEGTIFSANGNGKITVLHDFRNDGLTGNDPESNFILAEDGFFYGTTAKGGLPFDDPHREGTVYRADTKGNVKLLHTFLVSDGMTPAAPPARDPETGDLYATAIRGGNQSDGTTVKIPGKK
ncbi:MAG: hypothetical protein JO056_03590 [Alphaproteobacteria bacterium]|nr:hypothetical protein [Alphaproteobacteria bacterium]